ncbi:MAG TPA: PAAR-like domain-containing protein [Longimicrobium sp.]
MSTVGINPPKTPVTTGSRGTAKATTPNVCKMPGPPAPFVPSPLPNIAKSGSSPQGYSKDVTIEGNTVAIRGAMFESMGDLASKGTGGGLISANTHGPAKFITFGSLDVKIEGKSVHLLGEPMLNNCGPTGSPPNTGATLQGVRQDSSRARAVLAEIAKSCDGSVSPTHEDGPKKGQKKSCTALGTEKHACCEKKIQEHRAANPENGDPPIEGEQGYRRPSLDQNNRPVANADGTFPAPQPTGAPRPDLGAAFKAGGSAVREAFAALSGNCYPDAAILNADGSKTFVDFKFPCPEGHPSGKGTSRGGANTSMSPRQQGSYDGLGYGTGNGEAIVISP